MNLKNKYKNKYIIIRDDEKNINISEMIIFFLQLRTDIKMFHWQTKFYSHHKVSDELLESIDLLSDKLIEALLGKLDKRPDVNNNIMIRNINRKKINEILIQANKYLTKGFEDITFTEILSIRDEIIEAIDKALYLLTFV